MPTTTDPLPLRPRGAARHAAGPTVTATPPTRPARQVVAHPSTQPVSSGAAVAPEATGAAVSPPAAPVSDPDRRAALRSHRAATGPTRRATDDPSSRPAVDHASSRPAVDRAPSRPTVGPAQSRRSAARSPSLDTGDRLPSRRDLRPSRRPVGPGDLGRAVTAAAALPFRSIGRTVGSARSVPLTATAVVACLVVSVSTPATAASAATVPEAARPVLGAQQFTATAGPDAAVHRDGFGIGRVPEAAARPTPGGVPSTRASGAVRPVLGSIPTAGGFGSRWVRGCGACSTNHQGLDFAAPEGTAVVATMSGKVVSAGVLGGYGNQVLVQHGDGTQTRYGHLSRIGVRVGQDVAAGERVGAVGSTGVSTGPHLHFEVIVGGRPVDPATWLSVQGLL